MDFETFDKAYAIKKDIEEIEQDIENIEKSDDYTLDFLESYIAEDRKCNLNRHIKSIPYSIVKNMCLSYLKEQLKTLEKEFKEL